MQYSQTSKNHLWSIPNKINTMSSTHIITEVEKVLIHKTHGLMDAPASHPSKLVIERDWHMKDGFLCRAPKDVDHPMWRIYKHLRFHKMGQIHRSGKRESSPSLAPPQGWKAHPHLGYQPCYCSFSTCWSSCRHPLLSDGALQFTIHTLLFKSSHISKRLSHSLSLE